MAKKVKIAGYAKRIFFNDNIEYRNFSPDLVGFQLTSEGGTTLFTNGNFSIDANLDPKPDVLFIQGTKSQLYTLDDIVESGGVQSDIANNIKIFLNLDLTNPLSYIWYGSSKELLRSSLIQIQNNWPAAIYVDNKIGSITGNNITDYIYDIESNESTFKVNSNFFENPYNIKYTVDDQYTPTEQVENPLRNFTLKYGSYVIEHNGIRKNIKQITPATQKTNAEIELVVDGNPFPELTGIYIPQLSFLMNNVDASIPYFIKPNENEVEKFFTGLNDFERNILNRDISPIYTSQFISTRYTDEGVLLTTMETYRFPLLSDGYNLNFFDSDYVAYLDTLNELCDGLDETNTDIIVRKYTTEAISSFDTVPRGDGNDLTLNGEKATKLLRIYGVEFDYIKKYINGIKFAHVVTYDKKNNVPDSLVKDLSHMLGLDPVNFINDVTFSKLYLPSNGGGQFSGTSVNLTQKQIETELYRRLILNVAWLWKSKGSRKAVEFLFRFIGAPESLVNFNEYVVVLDKPLDMEEIKRLLYIYTGEVNLNNIPYDDNGYPLPPRNGDLVINTFFDPITNQIVENEISEMYFQKAGGWYRETYGSDVVTNLNGNNPHAGPYDGGSEYLQYFSRCYIPNFDNEPTVLITADTLVQNYFTNYNYGIFNGTPTGSTSAFTTQLTYNTNTGGYQPIDNCLNVEYSIVETPLQNDGKTTLQQAFNEAEAKYNEFLELIKENKYLVYSPEWQVIKNNYELSLTNCLNEVATEDCDINKTLEICLSDVEVESVEYSCDNLSLNECLPFYYYTNSDGIKVSFDEFPQCCSSLDARFISYINEYGRTAEYCSASAPCIGEPSSELSNGIVVFTTTNNNTPDNIFQIQNRCYQYILEDDIPLSDFESTFGMSPEEYIISYNSGSPEVDPMNFEKLFIIVSCNIETIISSPECCAWHGFDYTTINVDDKNYIVCVSSNALTTPEFVTPISVDGDNFTMPLIDVAVNTSYYDLQNPIGAVYSYYSTEMFWDCFNESIIIKEVITTEGNLITPIPNSIVDDPDLMNPENWEVFSIDEYGRVSFTPSIYDNNFVLDWYSNGQLSDLYREIAELYGYSFGSFTIDFNNNTLIPYNGVGSYNNNPNVIFHTAVDPNRIVCDKVDNVSIVFASEKWQGFKLPELEDCSCTIDFSFDYMLKYNTGNLIECANTISCHPAIIYDNTINNINCLNFVAFTNTDEESQTLQNNFNDNENVTEEYVIWQNTNVLEPNNECCNAIGGNVVPFSQWASINSTWVSQIDQTYNSLFAATPVIIESLNFNTAEMIGYIDTYKDIKSELEELIQECLTLTLVFPPCDINYGEYINTQSVCSLEVPLECGLWTKILTDYRVLKDAITGLIEQYNLKCSKEEDTPIYPPMVEIDGIKAYNRLGTELEEELNGLKDEEDKFKEEIFKLQNDIDEKNSDNTIIEKALTNVNTPTDCTVYENKLTEIRNFDYSFYCNSVVYGGGNLNNGSKQSEYNHCISSKTIENQNDEVVYSQLLSDCRRKNSIEIELINAKFENNQPLIDELEKQLNDVNQDINRLTTDFNNEISYDQSKQKSDLENNDTQYTINQTAKLLNTTSEDITDENGNLVLSDTQKINLNIQYTKNKSQISDLNGEISDLQFLLNENLKNQNQTVRETNKEQNILKADVGGGKGDPPPPPSVFGCAKFLNELIYDGQYKYKIIPPTSPTLDDIITLSMSPSYYSSNWAPVPNTPNLYVKGPCYASRRPSIQTNPAIGVSNTLNCNFDPNGFTITVDGVVLYNGQNITPECCDSEILNIGNTVNLVGKECKIRNITFDNPFVLRCCRRIKLSSIEDLLNRVEVQISSIEDKTQTCYDNWYMQLQENYNEFEESNNTFFDNYLDDLKINFKLFVNNTNIDIDTNIDTGLTYLPYTQSVNPIWEWDPSVGYSGVILEGDEQEISLITESIFNHLSQQGVDYNSNLFEPDWKTFNFTIPECICDDLRRLYPNKEFFFSIEIENFECSLCLLVDNIQVNVSDCQTTRMLSINDCMIPQLSCVIDNKKSWVYYDDGVIRETIYPNGECNTDSQNNYEIIKLGEQQDRLWLDLEYRYTDYSINHSDLILNVKNTTFSIDPAKAIECDVFNYWKNIDCDNCPTKCVDDSKVFEDNDDFLFQDCNTYIFENQSTLLSVVFSGEVLSSGYTLTFDDITTSGLTFSCSTYTDVLEQKVLELKNKYYSLTSDYIESLDATYQQLLDKGETLNDFYIQENNCGTDTIVINDNSSLNNLFGIITENYDGTISLFETYLYSGTTPYSGGVLSEVLSGITAQTFNQQLGIDQECCEKINDLLNGEGVGGLGLGKNYQWDSGNCFCTWKPLDDCANCKGDCEYCGKKKECVDGFATGETYSVCINPLDYLDIQPSEINVKAVFDQLVQTNLIDAKSRQTISDYPMLRLFYELYLNANNCGKDLSGKFTYDTMFEFMDKIGDYWLDLIEQVVPATTIWDGCDNSGKVYRNTIFDQNKFEYKGYSTNFIDVDLECPLSAQTNYSIGSETTYCLVEQKPIYPSSPEITQVKNDILNKEVEITLLIKTIATENSKLCALNLQDLNTPNLQNLIDQQQNSIDLLNVDLNGLNTQLTDLKNELVELENQYIAQQENYYNNFMSCSGLTQSLINAQNDLLTGFTQGTTAYERQRNFIAGLRDKHSKCIRQANTLVSDYNTIFLTQIYDTNEYEGNVIITGDPDFDEPLYIKTFPPVQISGWYYNQELIHNCDSTL